jgi:DNA-binding NtrC family response regulator
MERAMSMSVGGTLGLEHLPPRVAGSARPPATTNTSAPAASDARNSARDDTSVLHLKGELFTAERRRLLDALGACGGNQTRAAERLGISRRTLLTRLVEYDVPRPRKG